MIVGVINYYKEELEKKDRLIARLRESLKFQSYVTDGAMDNCANCKGRIRFEWSTKTWEHLGGKKRHPAWPARYKMWVVDDPLGKEWLAPDTARNLVYETKENDGDVA